MTPNELWDIFEEAYLSCPNTDDLYDDQYEMEYDTYGKLKKTYEKVISYWLDESTIGGHILLNYG